MRTGTAKTFDLDRDLKSWTRRSAPIDQRRQPGPVGVQGARRQAAALSRLERHRDLARQHDQLLPERAVEDGRQAGRLDAAVHGARHGSTAAGRPGPESGELDGGARALARIGTPRPTRSTRVHVTNNRVDMTRPLCPYPAGGAVQGRRAAPTTPRTSSARRLRRTALTRRHEARSEPIEVRVFSSLGRRFLKRCA